MVIFRKFLQFPTIKRGIKNDGRPNWTLIFLNLNKPVRMKEIINEPNSSSKSYRVKTTINPYRTGQNRRIEYDIHNIDVDSISGKTYTVNTGKSHNGNRFVQYGRHILLSPFLQVSVLRKDIGE